MTSLRAAMRPLTMPEITSSPSISSTPSIPTSGPRKEGGASASCGKVLLLGTSERWIILSMNSPAQATTQPRRDHVRKKRQSKHLFHALLFRRELSGVRGLTHTFRPYASRIIDLGKEVAPAFGSHVEKAPERI